MSPASKTDSSGSRSSLSRFVCSHQRASDAQTSQVRPDTDYTAELGPPIPRGAWKDDAVPVASTSRLRGNDSPPRTDLHLSTHLALNPHSRHDDTESSDEEFSSSDSEQMVEGLSGLRKLTLRRTKSYTAHKEDSDAINARFHGKSSLLGLIDATRRYKELHISDSAAAEPEHATAGPPRAIPESYPPTKRPEFWVAHPVGPSEIHDTSDSHLFSSGNYSGKASTSMLTRCLFLC